MSRIHVARLGVSLREVRTLLANEHRPHLRQRLRALDMILTGATVGRAASAADTSKVTVERWLRAARKGGCAALLNARSGVRTEERMTTDEVNKLREQIRAALSDGVNWRLAKRLIVVDRVLAGEKREQVARDASVSPETLRRWIAAVRDKGLSAMVYRTDYRARPLDSDLEAAELRGWARTEANPRVARRLLALAYVADGLSVDDAAVRTKSSATALRDWLLRFRHGGVDALYDRKLGRLEQRRELKAFIRRNAGAGHEELCKKVQARFGPRYSPRYVRNVAKETIGSS